jgi:cell division protein FtsN
MITGQLPIEYKNNTTLENVFNQAYYYVNIGPFSSINLAEQALKTIKSTYKSAYIVKKK